jgi:hypothetical protein
VRRFYRLALSGFGFLAILATTFSQNYGKADRNWHGKSGAQTAKGASE